MHEISVPADPELIVVRPPNQWTEQDRNFYESIGGTLSGVTLYRVNGGTAEAGRKFRCNEGCNINDWKQGKFVYEPHFDLRGTRGLCSVTLQNSVYTWYSYNCDVILLRMNPEHYLEGGIERSEIRPMVIRYLILYRIVIRELLRTGNYLVNFMKNPRRRQT